MATASNWSELEKLLKNKINTALQTHVAQAVKEEIRYAVESEVYESGEPTVYERRYFQNGSLGDYESMNAEIVEDGVLRVENDADFNHEFAAKYAGKPNYGSVDREHKSLAENIEFGYGSKQAWYNEPRPFMATAKENLEMNKSHIEAMKDGLKAQGLNVK